MRKKLLSKAFKTLSLDVSFMRILLVCMAAIFDFATSAATITINKVKYNIYTTSNASVSGFESGITAANILSTVTYQDKDYPVTSIGYGAFRDCSGLTSITIPNSVTLIDGYAFDGCSGLTSVTIPNSVTSIGACAFRNCTGLTSVTIPNSVKKIGDDAFSRCTGLTSVTIPNSVTSIGAWAFSTCLGLTSVIIPNSVTSIGGGAFYNCTGLISVTIGNSVTTIGSSAFQDCSGLTSVIIGNSVTSIGQYAFYHCNGLKKSAYPSTLSKNPFENGLVIKYPAEGAEIEDGFVWSPNKTAIYFAPFSLEGKYEFPESVTEVGADAFRLCEGLTGVNTPSLDAWLKISFGNQYSNPTFYGKKLLVNGNANKRITLPQGTTRLNGYAFINCEDILTVSVPSSLESSGNYPFNGCTALQRITFPDEASFLKINYDTSTSHLNDGNTAKYYIGSEVYAPTSITIPESQNFIPDYAFYNWTTLKDITMHGNIVSIGNSAFYNCKYVPSITMPKSVTEIGNSAFYGWSALKSVYVEDVNAWARIKFGNATANPLNYGHNLYVGTGTTPIKHLVITGEEPVSDFAFESGTKLETVLIKDGAPVGAQAFERCVNLTDVCLNTASLGNLTFGSDTKIKNVYVPVKTPPTAPNEAFSNYDQVNLYVPTGCVSDYENAETCWWNFLNIFESDFINIDTIFAPDYENGSSGIDNVVSEDATVRSNDIYNLQGVLLKRNATADDIRALSPGLYIIAGKKVMVK